jgi:hypothetical protein
MQVYAYSLEGDDELTARLLAGRGPADRFQWYARLWRKGGHRVRRRVHATDLFGPSSVADSAPLERAIFLRRLDTSSFATHALSVDEAARTAAAIIDYELDMLRSWRSAVVSSGFENSLFDRGRGTNDPEAIVRSALRSSGADCQLIDIPLNASPDHVAEYVSEAAEK